MIMDLTEAITMIKNGEIDAQENPLTNTVTYGVHKFHRFHTLSNHFYISRPIFLHRPTYESWPDDLRAAMQTAIAEAVAFQRDLHEREETEAQKAIDANAAKPSRSAPTSTPRSSRRCSPCCARRNGSTAMTCSSLPEPE